jgi:hypothetical protein
MINPFTDAIEVAVFPDFESIDIARRILDRTPGARGILWWGELTDGRFALWSEFGGDLEDKLVVYAKSQIGTEILPTEDVSSGLTTYTNYWTL